MPLGRTLQLRRARIPESGNRNRSGTRALKGAPAKVVDAVLQSTRDTQVVAHDETSGKEGSRSTDAGSAQAPGAGSTVAAEDQFARRGWDTGLVCHGASAEGRALARQADHVRDAAGHALVVAHGGASGRRQPPAPALPRKMDGHEIFSALRPNGFTDHEKWRRVPQPRSAAQGTGSRLFGEKGEKDFSR